MQLEEKCKDAHEMAISEALTETAEHFASLGQGKLVIDELVAQLGAVQYYDVHEDGDNLHYTLAVCSKDVDDPLSKVGLYEELGIPRDAEEDNPFKTQFEMLSRFNSPGIIKAKQCFSDGELSYMLLERISGRKLSEVRGLNEADVRQIGIQLCQIADSFHRQRLVHNGLEPDSILIDERCRIKVIRFDRVRPARRYDPTVPLEPIDSYSAPEIYTLTEKSVLDRRSDIYAIGAIMYFLLTGQPLPPANEMNDFVYEFYPTAVVSPALERIIMRAISPDPADRYNSVNEVKFALTGLSAPTSVQVGYASDVGKIRDLNEDSVLVLDLRQCFESLGTHIGLYVVSDGMGGEAAGEVASRIAVRAVAEWVTDKLISASLRSTHGSQLAEPTQTGSLMLASDTGVDIKASKLLTDAICYANSEVLDYAQYHPTTRGLGATLTAALLVGNTLTVGHVGDSRCYLLSAGRIQQITEDHSLVERMVRRGELTREEAKIHPNRNIIYRSIGSRREIEVDVLTRSLRRGDYVLLCSDGLTSMLSDEQIELILKRNTDPAQAAKELVVAANAAGGEDNVSVIVVAVD
ncbi:MAG: Stp1/IreP family PP2C-type Ser/Thr phosphatase [Acidobacteriota bacterium]|nr:Stp1/IreP family PP2C-type Ser/Thr phosphatase [Blastocatellia bacterium]MDW8413704.1 Stp1/IreP family PP2C-type Ser/Thr phosphatase [Acidobacteriota bacterium]